MRKIDNEVYGKWFQQYFVLTNIYLDDKNNSRFAGFDMAYTFYVSLSEKVKNSLRFKIK